MHSLNLGVKVDFLIDGTIKINGNQVQLMIDDYPLRVVRVLRTGFKRFMFKADDNNNYYVKIYTNNLHKIKQIEEDEENEYFINSKTKATIIDNVIRFNEKVICQLEPGWDKVLFGCTSTKANLNFPNIRAIYGDKEIPLFLIGKANKNHEPFSKYYKDKGGDFLEQHSHFCWFPKLNFTSDTIIYNPAQIKSARKI